MNKHFILISMISILSTCASIPAEAPPFPLFLHEFLIADAQISEVGAPHVESYFIPAEACKELPRFKSLLEDNPNSNKILFRLQNFPKNQEMMMEVKRTASFKPSTYELLKTFTINDNNAIVGDDQKPIPALVVSSYGYLPGERATFRFRTTNGSLSKEVSLYPKPLIARDKNTQPALRAELVSLVPTVYQIELLNMKEGEDYEFVSISGGEIVKSKATFHKGVPINYTPAIGKVKGGTSRVEVRKKSGDVTVISFPWGTELKHHLDH